MTNTIGDFKHLLGNSSPEPVESLTLGLSWPEPVNSVLADIKSQVGEVLSPVTLSDPIERLVETAHELHLSTNGATISLRHGNMVGRPLFAVSIYPKRSRHLSVVPSREAIRAFVLLNFDLLSRPFRALGTWFDPSRNLHVFDVVTCVSELHVAVELARMCGQLSVFDLAMMREIAVEEASVRAGSISVIAFFDKATSAKFPDPHEQNGEGSVP